MAPVLATLSWSRGLDLTADTAVTVQCESEGSLHIDPGPGSHVWASYSRIVATKVGSLG